MLPLIAGDSLGSLAHTTPDDSAEKKSRLSRTLSRRIPMRLGAVSSKRVKKLFTLPMKSPRKSGLIGPMPTRGAHVLIEQNPA